MLAVALSADGHAGHLQCLDIGGAVGDVAEAHAVMSNGVLELGETVTHADHHRLELFPEADGRFAVAPVPEVRVGCRGVLNDEVIDAILQPAGPAKDAGHAGGVRGDDADGREADPERGHLIEHAVEPLVGHLPGAGAHVGENDLRVPVDAIEEVVQSRRRVDVAFQRLREVVLEAAARLVFGIQIEQRGGYALSFVPVRESGHGAGLADATFAAHREYDALRLSWCSHKVVLSLRGANRLSGSLLRSPAVYFRVCHRPGSWE